MSEPQTPDPFVRRLVALMVTVGTVGGALLWWLRRERPAPVTYPDATSLLDEPSVEAYVERLDDNRLRVCWFVEAETIVVYGGPHPDAINTDEPLAVTSDETSAVIGPLEGMPRPVFRLDFMGGPLDGQHRIVAEREVPLTGTVNFRDIGGYHTSDGRRVRWGRVYRAGSLSQLTTDDHATLSAMGLRVVCDLRTQEESAQAPDVLPPDVAYVGLPVQTSEPIARQIRSLFRYRKQMHMAVIDAYTRLMVDGNPSVFAGLFESLADADALPLALHCAAGKDRTGIATAFLLDILGVPDAVILADYSLSNRYADVFRAHTEDMVRPLKRLGMGDSTLVPLFTADPATMAATLAHVRERYGSVEDYLTGAAGVAPETLYRVKQNLLEREP